MAKAKKNISQIFVKLFGNELKKLQPDSSVNKGLVYLPEERKSEGIFPNLDVKENSTIIILNKLYQPYHRLVLENFSYDGLHLLYLKD